MDPNPTWIVLAQILRPQGRKGEVLADLLTDVPGRFASHPQVFLAPPGLAEPASENSSSSTPFPPPQPADVASHWLPVGRNTGRIVLGFAGVSTIEQAEALAGQQVIVPFTERVALEPGATYVSDLIGCTVYDRDLPLGLVESVEFATTPDGSRRLEDAAPLLAVTSLDGSELLIPFANAFILELDLPSKAIRMALPEGLTQINRPTPADH